MRVFHGFTAAVSAMAGVLGAFWVAGFDFDESGGTAIKCYVAAIVAAAYAFGFTMMFTEKQK